MIISVYEKLKMKRLEEKNIVIESIYINPSKPEDYPYIRATDGKVLNNIRNFPLKEKRYFHNNECIYTDKKFNQDILYNIETYEDENQIISCPNCGHNGKVSEMIDGCPYCRSVFNFEIGDKVVGKKQLKYKYKFSFLSLIILSCLFTILMCDKITWEDFCDIYPFGLGVAFPLSIIATFIINCIKYNKDETYGLDKNLLWNNPRNEKTFYNNLFCELMINLYDKDDLIDFEIVNYEKIDFVSDNEIIVYCKIREIFYNTQISSNETVYKIKLIYNDNKIEVNEDSFKVVKCHGCGATINVTDKHCQFCRRINDSNNEWFINSIEKYF